MLRLVGGQVESLFDELLRWKSGSCRRISRPWIGLLGDLRLLAPIEAWEQICPRSWPPDDPDGQLRPADGGQAAHRLGLRDPDPGGVGPAAPAPVLPADPASTGGVDGACKLVRRLSPRSSPN